jgi:hypothetical protein
MKKIARKLPKRKEKNKENLKNKEVEMIVIVNFEINEDFSQNPLIKNLKETLSLSSFFDAIPEIWKLNDSYSESVCEYLKIRKTQLIYKDLWGISMDLSSSVGLITKEKFYPVIR